MAGSDLGRFHHSLEKLVPVPNDRPEGPEWVAKLISD